METVALELGTGRVLWRRPPAPGWDGIPVDRREALLAGIDPDFLSVPVLEDGVLLVLHLEPVALGRSETHARIDIRRFLPARRLHALNSRTGELLWKVDASWREGGKPRNLAASPPAAAAGRVFLPIYDAVGTLDLSLAAFDLKTGEPLWKSFAVTGQKESNLFGNVLVELASGIPAADAATVVFCTNLGTINAFHAATGMALWTRLYTRTPVRLFQTGREALRPETFSHGPPAFDGTRFACAPIDGISALLLDVSAGNLLADWEVLDENGALRSLLGMGPSGAWFTGSRACFLGAGGARSFFSPPLHDLYSRPEQQHAGALIRGAFLAPSARALEILDPLDFRPLGTVLQWDSGSEAGPIQAAPGTLLVMRPTGVTAFRTPDALLSTFLSEESESGGLPGILSLLEQTPLEVGDILAESAALHAEALAEGSQSNTLALRLSLFAAKAWASADKPTETGRVLASLLEGPRPGLAACAVADHLAQALPSSTLLLKAVEILERNPLREVPRGKGGRESQGLIAARLRVISAAARGYGRLEMEALLSLLAREDLGDSGGSVHPSMAQEDSSLESWAVGRLRKLATQPRHAQALETAAQESLQKPPFSSSWVRRFGTTQTVRVRLAHLLADTHAPREERVRAARWLRKYTASPPPLPRDFRLENPPPRLPSTLEIIQKIPVGNARLLAASPVPGGITALLQEGGSVAFIRLDSAGATRGAFQRVLSGNGPAIDLGERTWMEGESTVILTPRRWIQLRPDGSEREWGLPLEGRIPARPLRLGDFIAFPTAAGSGALEVRDLATGELLFGASLERQANRFLHLIPRAGGVLLLEEKLPLARVFSFSRQRPLAWPLTVAPLTYEMESSVPFEDGIAIPRRGAQSTTILFSGPGPRAMGDFPQPSLVGIRTFSAPGGAGWLLDPLLPGQGETPTPRIAWRPEGADAPAFLDLLPGIQLPQIDSFSRLDHHLPSAEILGFVEDPGGGTLFQCIRLGSAPAVVWENRLPDLPFARLARRQPEPIAGREGWACRLALGGGARGPEETQVLLFDGKGDLAGRFRTPASPSGRSELFATGGFLVLRTGSDLYLLGKP